ncbi:MAG: hypothetical protein HY863_19940 [Chloroflexi bacterium]|nr:hypothetical protein [Chloroflexota bacterium]
MLYKLSRRLRKYAKGWLIVVLFLVDAVFTFFLMPFINAFIARTSTAPVPDLMFFYTPQTVYTAIANYGEYLRRFNITVNLTVDLVYPLVYTLFFSLLITWLFKKGFSPNSEMQMLNVVPFVTLLFDLLENFGLVTMLSIYPATPVNLAWATAIFSAAKWIFAGMSILLMLIGIGAAAVNQTGKVPTDNAREIAFNRPVARVTFAGDNDQKRKG